MKISVLIIAHNEERYIDRCIKSILDQTYRPDEVILVAHNCRDKTIEIARKYNFIKIIDFKGEPGVTHARIKGMKEVSGDIICCIDGDSCATKNWVDKLIEPFCNNNVILTCSTVIYTKSIFPFLNSIYYFYIKRLLPSFLLSLPFYPYGPSFAIRKNVYDKIGGFEPFIKLKNDLNLQTWPDDAYIGLKCREIGKVVFVKGPIVFAVAKEKGLMALVRGKKDIFSGKMLKKYFKL